MRYASSAQTLTHWTNASYYRTIPCKGIVRNKNLEAWRVTMQDFALALNRLPESYTQPSPTPIRSNPVVTIDKAEYKEAKNCLSTIKDPLWRHVCQEIITMMGPASLLKIWNSHLGEVDSNKKIMEIQCPTEEASQFIQQYAFVILGCLQPYFPTLKKLNVKTIGS